MINWKARKLEKTRFSFCSKCSSTSVVTGTTNAFVDKANMRGGCKAQAHLVNVTVFPERFGRVFSNRLPEVVQL